MGFSVDGINRIYSCRRKRCTDAAPGLFGVLFSDVYVGQECSYCHEVMR